VTQALSDLPGMVKDLVQKQLNDKFEPLTERALQALRSRGGASPENRELMAQQTILDALPYIEQELEPLREKLSLIQSFGDQIGNGMMRDAHSTLEKLSSVVTTENPNGALTPIAQLVESMITAVIQFLAKSNGLPTGMERMTNACCRMCSQNSTLSMAPIISQRLKEHHELGMNMGPNVSHLAAIMPGLGTYEIDPAEKRGGFIGIGSAILAAVLPALVSGSMSLIGKAITKNSDDRGSGFLTSLPTLEKDMKAAFEDILVKAIAKRTNYDEAAVKRELKTVTGPHRAAKRQKIK
jgi:hypothetical protein